MRAEKPKIEAEDAEDGEPKDRAISRNTSGRVKHDDRGNAVWEWSIATGAFSADVSGEPLKRLDNKTLALADDSPSPFEVVPANPHGLRKGYNPYDSGRLSKQRDKAPPKKTDLRRLSEWMKLKKQHAKLKNEE